MKPEVSRGYYIPLGSFHWRSSGHSCSPLPVCHRKCELNFFFSLLWPDEEEEKPKTKKVKETVSEWEQVNKNKAIWLRDPSEVTKDEYENFYKSVAKVSAQKTPSLLYWVWLELKRLSKQEPQAPKETAVWQRTVWCSRLGQPKLHIMERCVTLGNLQKT